MVEGEPVEFVAAHSRFSFVDASGSPHHLDVPYRCRVELRSFLDDLGNVAAVAIDFKRKLARDTTEKVDGTISALTFRHVPGRGAVGNVVDVHVEHVTWSVWDDGMLHGLGEWVEGPSSHPVTREQHPDAEVSLFSMNVVE